MAMLMDPQSGYNLDRYRQMTNLQISLFGAYQVALDSTPLTEFESVKVRALLAYLAVERTRPHSRDTLAGLFWSEQSDTAARRNLRQALSNLRKTLRDDRAASPFLLVTRSAVQFDPHSSHTLDVARFSNLLETCDRHRHRRLGACGACVRRLEQAVALYRGDFLRGFYIEDSVAFQDWVILTRERYHRQTVQTLSALVDYHEARRDYRTARRYANLQVELDPWREEAHRRLMRLLALSGERSAALMQFTRCRKTLKRELGVPPSPETRVLYERIKTGDLDARQPAPLPTNLPPEMTPFVGREPELHALTGYLSDPDIRLLTLVGPGGVGKTRLALQAAAGELHHFAQGVYWVPLSGVRTVQGIPLAIADALRFSFQGRAEPLDQLINYLREKEILLVLDSFEHLLEGVDTCLQILRRAPGVVMLVTSRQRLGVQAEQIVPVEGLPYPERNDLPDLEEYAAIRLFLRRARSARPALFVSGARRTTGSTDQLPAGEGNPAGAGQFRAFTRGSGYLPPDFAPRPRCGDAGDLPPAVGSAGRADRPCGGVAVPGAE